VVADGRVVVRGLGAPDEVRRELDALRFGLRRIALPRGSPASMDAARASVARSAERLDELMLAPVGRLVGERPLVLVPTGALHAVPWAVLPSCAGRPVVVAPSAGLWLRAERSALGSANPVVLVAGPDLPGAADEIDRLARRYRGARRLGGRRATAEAAAAALDGSGLAHVAAHGSFRADNPLFSSLRLADGPLTVYDLERLRRAPQTLVLSACEAGLADVGVGDELMGLAAALLSIGTGCVVAGVGLAPDWATRSLMLDLHRRLRAGSRPAEALAAAQASISGRVADPDAALAARAAFVCLGAG
jgi:CHAT domain-containing protein